MKLGHTVGTAAVLALAAVSCRQSDSAQQNDKPAVERGDQLAITTRDGNVVLALTQANTIAMRVSDSLRQVVNAEVAREFASDSADSRFGRWIQRKTADLVAKGMAMEFSIGVDEIEDVRYEDGEIQFEYRSDRMLKFGSFKNDGRSPLRDFRPEDAERFVEAVRNARAARN